MIHNVAIIQVIRKALIYTLHRYFIRNDEEPDRLIDGSEVNRMEDNVRRRPVGRLTFSNGLKGEMRLMNHRGQRLSEAHAVVIVLNMSPDGLCFMSGLRLPVNRRYLVDFRFTAGGLLLNVRGHIGWRRMVDNHYEYGVAFYPPDKLRPLLIGILNEELLRRSPSDYKVHGLYRKLIDKASRL